MEVRNAELYDYRCPNARQKEAVLLRFRGLRKGRESYASTASFFFPNRESHGGLPVWGYGGQIRYEHSYHLVRPKKYRTKKPRSLNGFRFFYVHFSSGKKISEDWGKDGKPAFRWKQEHMKKGVDILENPLKSDIEKARIEAVR